MIPSFNLQVQTCILAFEAIFPGADLVAAGVDNSSAVERWSSQLKQQLIQLIVVVVVDRFGDRFVDHWQSLAAVVVDLLQLLRRQLPQLADFVVVVVDSAAAAERHAADKAAVSSRIQSLW